MPCKGHQSGSATVANGAFGLQLVFVDELMDERLKRALRRTPVLFLLMAANLFRLRGVNRRFIHTEHGKTEVKP